MRPFPLFAKERGCERGHNGKIFLWRKWERGNSQCSSGTHFYDQLQLFLTE